MELDKVILKFLPIDYKIYTEEDFSREVKLGCSSEPQSGSRVRYSRQDIGDKRNNWHETEAFIKSLSAYKPI